MQEIKESSQNQAATAGQNDLSAATSRENAEQPLNKAQTGGELAAAPCSAGFVTLPKSKWVINLNNVLCVGPFYDPRYDTGMIMGNTGQVVGLPKEAFEELLEVMEEKRA